MSDVKIECPFPTCRVDTELARAEIIPFEPQGLEFACPRCRRRYTVSRRDDVVVVRRPPPD